MDGFDGRPTLGEGENFLIFDRFVRERGVLKIIFIADDLGPAARRQLLAAGYVVGLKMGLKSFYELAAIFGGKTLIEIKDFVT